MESEQRDAVSQAAMPKKITLEAEIGDARYLVDVRIVEPFLFRVTRIVDGDRSLITGDIQELAPLADLLKAAASAHSVAAVRERQGRQQPPRFEQIRLRHPRAYTPWTPEEDERLAELARKELSAAQIADELGRNAGAVNSRLNRLSP